MLSPTDPVLNQMFSERGGVTGAAVFSAVKPGVVLNEQIPVNGTFENDVSGWQQVGGTIARSTAQKRSGAASMRVTPTGSSLRTISEPFDYPMPGATATLRAYALSAGDADATQGFVAVLAYDALGNQIGIGSGSTVLLSTSTWSLVPVSWTLPAGTKRIRAGLRTLASSGTTSVAYFDDVTFALSGTVDVDMGGSIEQVTVTRELAGDLPDLLSLIGGVETTTVRIDSDLRGLGPHAAKQADREQWVYPNTAPVVLRGGISGYDADVPIHKGPVRSLDFDEESNSRPMELMDRSDEFRVPVTVAYYGSYADRLNPGKVKRFPTNLTAVIVAACHAAGFRITPAPSSDCVFSAPYVAGAIAEMGWTVPYGDSIEPGDSWLGTGRFGKVPARPSSKYWWAQGFAAVCPSTTAAAIQVEFWFARTASGQLVEVPFNIDGMSLLVSISSGNLIARVLKGDGTELARTTTAVPTSGAWHHFAARVETGPYDQTKISSRLNGGAKASTAMGFAAGVDYEYASCKIQATGYLQQISMHYKTSNADASWRLAGDDDFLSFTPKANLDLAALEVADLPAIDSRQAWDLTKELAAVELGMFGFSETGVPYFRNRASLNGSTTPVDTWSTDLVDKVAGGVDIDSVRTLATMPITNRWQLDSGLGADTPASTAVPAYMHTEPLTIPGGRSEFLIKVPKPIVPTSSLVTIPGASTDGWPGRVYQGSSMMLCNDPSGTPRYTGYAVTACIVPVDSTTWKLVVNNTGTAVKYAAWPKGYTGDNYPMDTQSGAKQFFGLADTGSGGKSSLILFGRVAVDDVSIKPSVVSVGSGTRQLDLPESPWMQDITSVTALLQQLLADTSIPKLRLGDITVPGDLRRQLGDLIQLDDWAGRVPSVLAKIVRLETVLGVEVADQGIQQKASFRT